MNRTERRPDPQRRPKLRELHDDWLRDIPSWRSRESYDVDWRQWRDFLKRRHIKVLDARRGDVHDWAEELRSRVTERTVARKLTAISSFYRHCVLEDALGENPLDRVRRPKVTQDLTTEPLTETEMLALIREVRAAAANVRALGLLLMLTGCRISEATTILASDYVAPAPGREPGVYVIRKGGRREFLPITAEVVDAIELVLRTGVETGRPLLGMNRYAAANRIWRLGQRAGVETRVHPHRLRHSFSTLLVAQGVPIPDVQRALGHRSPLTTLRIYTKATSDPALPSSTVAAQLADEDDVA
jgi:site-specific recombinase XerD